MLTSDHLPEQLPWQHPAYLLLDGVSVSNLLAKTQEWFGAPNVQLLYATTALAPCSDLSPCLITLNGLHTQGLEHYFSHLAEEWGYLIFSQASSFDVICHLRALLNAQYQPQGQKVWLRVADPAVMHVILSHATATKKPEVFGPMERVVLPDVINNTWQQHARVGDGARSLSEQPYALCEAQQALLDGVSFRATLKVLEKHLRDKFPDANTELPTQARWRWVSERVRRAYEAGFSSEHDICLYANVFMLLGDDVLLHHPDIAVLITQPTDVAPSLRIEKAAELALSRSDYFAGHRP